MTGRPAACIALALPSTASVADSAMAAMRAETLGLLGAMASIFSPRPARWALCSAVRRGGRRQRTLQHLVVLRQVAQACLRFQQRAVAQLARVPVSKTDGWGFESLLPCELARNPRAPHRREPAD